MTVDPQRRSALLGIKLSALVRDHLGEGGVASVGSIGRGAALVRDGEAWVLADITPGRYLGPALAWAHQQGAGALHLLAESDTGQLARRGAQFSFPVTTWRVEGRQLHRAEAEPLPDPPELEPRLVPLIDVIREGGAVPVVEHGVLTGEVRGLEVCRAELDLTLDVVRLGVGVGAHDREAFTIMHGDVPTALALAGVVETVDKHRRPGAEPHPLNRLVPERGLRHRLAREPWLVGARHLDPAPPPVARGGVMERWPSVAVGVDDRDRSLVVVCATGIDLDVVPFATDARRDGDRLVVVVPPRDAHAITAWQLAALRSPGELVTVG